MMRDNYIYKVIGDWRESYVFRYNAEGRMFDGTMVAAFSSDRDAHVYCDMMNGHMMAIEVDEYNELKNSHDLSADDFHDIELDDDDII